MQEREGIIESTFFVFACTGTGIGTACTDKPRMVQEAAAKISSARLGVPKTQAHKDAIAASQRRRAAAASILQAVESVHSAQPASAPAVGAG